jgi:ubiquinone/menaquinone biosynthesis C-methylase UbiE
MQDYKLQDRGSGTNYSGYLKSMDKVVVEKVASASSFFDPKPGNILVDVGMASGTSSNILALLFPRLKIIGVDINPKMVKIASQTYKLQNLEFRVDDGEKLKTFDKHAISGFFNCSSIHHITSFNGYQPSHAYNTLKRQTELLKNNGVIVVRDFVKPPEQEIILELSNAKEKNKMSDSDLIVSFSKTARSLASAEEQGFPLKELKAANKRTRKFQLFYSDAVEFIRRKDYYNDWQIELQEEYGYYTQKEFEEIFASLGLRIIISAPIYNPWIIKNRYRDKFVLSDIHSNDIGYPPTNYLIAGEKVKNKATHFQVVRHLPESENNFLKYASYKNKQTQKIYDVVQRPNSVLDIIPYILNDNNLEIIAKHGYPRPIITTDTDSATIDQKHYSGYISEGLTASKTDSVESVITMRTGLKSMDISEIEKSLEFFTSPGGINEKVESVFVKLKKLPSGLPGLINNFSGFAESGSLRRYDAAQLLKTAQTGALVEARLELNIYNLFKRLSIQLPHWLGEKIEIDETASLDIFPLKNLLTIKNKNFVGSDSRAGYLSKQRVKFAEIGVSDSSNVLEFVVPNDKSINTLVTLPVAKFKNKIYVGLETRDLPVPQIYFENSFITVAPALRLPKEINTYKDLENFILGLNISNAGIKRFYKLGEKYFPSVGITPEQVYPYVIIMDKLIDNLKWVSLDELYDNLESIKDGHLLISIARLVHALA